MNQLTTASPARRTEHQTERRAIPLGRVTVTELRKMFDTRSGLWVMASTLILALLTTSAIVAFGKQEEMTYATFARAINVPMTLVLPIIAILSVTGEWSQRSGLTTFTLVPHRGRVIAGKALACLAVAVVAVPVAFGIGALGNLAGTAIAGVDPVWDLRITNLLLIMLANILSMLVGFTLGVLIRGSAAALVTYVIYALLLPTLALLLASSQDWFHDLQPWVDLDFARRALLDGPLTVQQWTHLTVTGALWLVVPMIVGVRLVIRTEVK